MPRVVSVSADQSQISTDITNPAADGVAVTTVSVTVKQDRINANLEPMGMPHYAASNVVVSVTPSTGVTITQPTGTAGEDGAVTATFVSTNAATVSVGATAFGRTVTGNATVVVGGGAPPEPDPGDPFYASGTTEATVRENADGFTWNSTGSRVSVQTVPAGRSGYGLRFRYGPDANPGGDSSAEQRFNLGRDCSHLWVEYDLYVPSNFAHRWTTTYTANNKFAMFWRTTYSDVTNGTWRIGFEYTSGSGVTPDSTIRPISSRWDLNSWTDYSVTGGGTFISPTGPLDIDAWNQVRIELAAATDGASSDGIMRMWINGTLFASTTTGKFWNFDTGTDPADCFLRNGYLFGWSNSGFTDETDFFIHGAKFYDTDPGWL
jgi:hypothetical protein